MRRRCRICGLGAWRAAIDPESLRDRCPLNAIVHAKERGEQLPEEIKRLRRGFDRALSHLERAKSLTPHTLKPYELRVPRLSLNRTLRPYKEPKKSRR